MALVDVVEESIDSQGALRAELRGREGLPAARGGMSQPLPYLPLSGQTAGLWYRKRMTKEGVAQRSSMPAETIDKPTNNDITIILGLELGVVFEVTIMRP